MSRITGSKSHERLPFEMHFVLAFEYDLIELRKYLSVWYTVVLSKIQMIRIQDYIVIFEYHTQSMISFGESLLKLRYNSSQIKTDIVCQIYAIW